MKRLLTFVALLVLTIALGAQGRVGLAQDAAPAAECDAPALPPGTPTAAEDLAAFEEAETAEDNAQAAAGTLAAPVPADDGVPADEATTQAAIAAMENIVACINGGDYLGTAALLTQGFLEDFIQVPTAYDFPATMEGVGPIEIIQLDNVLAYEDGTVSVDFVFSGFFSGPNAVNSERWYLVEEDGIYKVAWTNPNALPADVLPDAVTVEVVMVDYAFHVEPKTIPAGQPVIFRVTNQAEATTGHVAVLLTYPEGTTAEQLIAGEVDVMEGSTGFFGAVYLEPGQSGDLAFTGLEAGTYFLGCDIETESGHLHFELGMITQITVE